MPPFEVRPATNDDLGAIVAGFAQACAKPVGAVDAKVRRALVENPFGWSGVVALDARARVVAHLGVSHVPMLIDGESVLFGRVCASWVDPLLQLAGVHGPFAEIDEVYRETLEGKAFAATFGMFVDSDWWTLRRLHDFAPVRSEIVLERPPAPHEAAGGPVTAVRLTPEALRGWEDGLALGGSHARRDAATLRYRTGGPWAADAAWVTERHGRPSGVLIVRENGASRVISDLSVLQADEESALALIEAAIGDGSRPIVLPHFSRSPWLFLVQRKGFRARATDTAYVVIRPSRARTDASALMDSWHFGACDVGFRPVPRLLAAEEPVTAAPSGTVSGRERHV